MITIKFDNELIDGNGIISLSQDYKMFDKSFYLGATPCRAVTLEIFKDYYTGTPEKVELFDDDVLYATLHVDSVELVDKVKYKLELTDAMTLFNEKYDASPLIEEGTTTLKDILDDICSKHDITCDTTSFYGDNKVITWYDNQRTARDYIGYIAELNGGYAIINEEGNLELKNFSNTSTNNINVSECEDFTLGEYHEISKVVYDTGTVKYEAGSDNANKKLTGNFITANNAIETDALKFELDGRTEQQTYSGKNLFNESAYLPGYYEGNNTVIINGVTGRNVIFYAKCNPSTNYTFKADLTDVNQVKMGCTSTTPDYDVLVTNVSVLTVDDVEQGYTYQTNSNAEYLVIRVQTIVDKTINYSDFSEIIENAQLEVGTTATPYEPYVGGKASPSKDYPQKIECLKGNNLLLNNATTGEQNGVTFTVNDDMSITLNGTATSGFSYYLFDSINQTLPAGNYTISTHGTGTQTGANGLYIRYNNESAKGVTLSNKTATINITSDYIYNRAYIYIANGATFTGYTIYPMLEKGTIATSYLPYNAIEIRNNGVNLYDYSDIKLIGTGASADNEGWITVEYDNTGGTSVKYVQYYTKPINVKPNTTYKIVLEVKELEIDNGNPSIYIINNQIADNMGQFEDRWFKNFSEIETDGVYIQNCTTREDFSNCTSAMRTLIAYGTGSGGAKGKIVFRISVRTDDIESASDFIYEAYKEKQYLVSLGTNELYEDDYVLNNILYKNTRHFQLRVADMNNGENYPGWTNLSQLVQDYPGQNRALKDVTDFWCNICGHNSTGININTNGNGTLFLPRGYYGSDYTQTYWKTNYSDLVVDVYYKLATAEPEELETEIFPEMYEGTNNISNSQNTNMAVTYETTGTGNTVYINSDNVYITGQIDINSIYDKIDNFEFYSFEIKNSPSINAKIGENLNIIDGDNIYKSITEISKTLNGSWVGGYSLNVDTEKLQETQIIDTETKVKNISSKLNRDEAQLEIVAQQATSIQDSLNDNYYNINQINTLIVNSETGITNTFSEAGGNNVFRNTGLWFANTDDDSDVNPYEFWSGLVERGSNEQSSSGHSLILQNDTLSQEQDVPNGSFSVSFWYKVVNPLATGTVKINDVTYNLTSTDWKQFYTGEKDENDEYIVNPLEVTARHIKIEFTCSIDDGIEVYDIMVNKGSTKLAWSQNQNETTTSTVNISKGITITSSDDENVKFKADYDGIRILDKQDNPKTKFTDKGMETNEALVKDQAQICGTLIIDVDDQTWFTRM